MASETTLAQQAASTTPSNPTASQVTATATLQADASALNDDFYNYLFIVLSALVVALSIWRLTNEAVKYVRKLTCLNNERQLYFVRASPSFASFKKHLLYAPLFGKRHNREFQISAAVNVGTLPTRLQALFVVAYLGTNVAYCVVGIHWDQSFTTVAKELRNRAGILAVTNLVSNIL